MESYRDFKSTRPASGKKLTIIPLENSPARLKTKSSAIFDQDLRSSREVMKLRPVVGKPQTAGMKNPWDIEVLPKKKKMISPLQQTVGVFTWTDMRRCRQKSGCGVLISNNLVLTSASNMFNKAKKSEKQGFKFYLSQSAQVPYDVVDWRYPQQYVKNGSKQFDYALAKLKEDPDNPILFNNFLHLSAPCTKCLPLNERLRLNIYDFFSRNQESSYSKEGEITKVLTEESLIEYDIQVESEKEGCPVVADSNIIAIHQHMNKKNYGVGRLITPDLVNNINKFCRELGENYVRISGKNLCICAKRINENKIQRELKNFLIRTQKKTHILFKPIEKSNDFSQLKIIDFTSKDNEKLVPESIEILSEIKLNNLQELKLDNNRIGDKGLEILCKNDYPKMKMVELDDNAVTINGLRYIFFNKWSDDVDYKLYSVESNDGGYHLNVDQNIPLIKSLVKQENMRDNKAIVRIEEKTVQSAVKLLLETPFQGEDSNKLEQQSKKLEQKYKEISNKNEMSLATVLLHLKKNLQNNLLFVNQDNLKSNVTSKILFNGFSNQRIGFEYDMSDVVKADSNYFRDNFLRMKQFQTQFLRHLHTQHQVDATDITLDKILDNPLRAVASDSFHQVVGKNKVLHENNRIQYKTYFEKFQLCESEFDSAGDFQFPPPQSASTQVRGGFPYYQPVIGKRFGIKVKNIFKDNKWLSMDNSKGEYAVAFHGINNPLTTTALQKIMKGREEGKMLKAGLSQAYSDGECINKKEKVGTGIYFSPYFLTSLFLYSSISLQQQHHVLLQCRLKPDAIKITSRPDYWVANKSEDARPYGIVLFTRDQVTQLQKIPNSSNSVSLHKQIYKNQFTQQSWKNKYEPQYLKFISK